MAEIIINGVKTNYRSTGPASAEVLANILILHGWGSNNERWQEVADILAKNGYKIIVPDLPGFGASQPLQSAWNLNNYVDWTEKFIQELGLKDYYLMGHSFGGALASKIAVKHAQDIKKMFLVSAACIRQKTAKKGFLSVIAKAVKMFSFLPFYPLFRKAVYKFVIRKSDYSYVQGIMKDTYLNVISENLTFHLPFVKIPTVVIWGDKDESTPLEDGQTISKQIKNSKLVVIPGAGHDLNRKQPEALAQAILSNIN